MIQKDLYINIVLEFCMSEHVNKYITEVALPMREIFKDMAKYTPSKLCGLLGNTVLVPVYTNLLSREEYGVYTVSVAVLSFLCVIFSDWIGLSGLRFFREHQLHHQISKYLSILVMLLGVNIFLLFLVAFIFRHNFYEFFKIPPALFMGIVFLTIPVAIRALLFQILRAQIKPSAFTISTIVNQVTTIIFSVLIIKYLHLGGASILWGMAISISLIDILLIYQSNILKHFKLEPISVSTLLSIIKYGIPIAIASTSLWVITQSNKLIIQHLKGLSESAIIGVGYSLTFPILMTFFAIFTIASFPRIINMYEDKMDVRPIISKITGYYFLVSLPLILLSSLYAKDITMLANAKFQEAYVLIPYLAASCFFLSLAEYTTMQYMLSKKTYINTIIKVIAGLIGVALNYVLIVKMGVVGSGIATLATNALYFVFSLMIVMPGLEWRVPYRRIEQILISFIPMMIFFYIFKFRTNIHPWIQMTLLLLIYSFAFAIIRRIKKDDKYVV